MFSIFVLSNFEMKVQDSIFRISESMKSPVFTKVTTVVVRDATTNPARRQAQPTSHKPHTSHISPSPFDRKSCPKNWSIA